MGSGSEDVACRSVNPGNVLWGLDDPVAQTTKESCGYLSPKSPLTITKKNQGR